MYKTIIQIFWPPFAVLNQSLTSRGQTYWKIICALCIFPLTAILHHAIFYRHTCILDRFGADYTPSVIYSWLSRDPSLPWSIIIMISSYYIGNHCNKFRILVYPAFVAFLPLSFWVWDIPFTGRYICNHFHYGRLVIFDTIPITRRYFYALGFVVWLLFVVHMLREQRLEVRRFRMHDAGDKIQDA